MGRGSHKTVPIEHILGFMEQLIGCSVTEPYIFEESIFWGSMYSKARTGKSPKNAAARKCKINGRGMVLFIFERNVNPLGKSVLSLTYFLFSIRDVTQAWLTRLGD